MSAGGLWAVELPFTEDEPASLPGARRYPPVWRDWISWRRAVKEELLLSASAERLRAIEEPDELRRKRRFAAAESIERRAVGWGLCGLQTSFRQCVPCGEPRALSGHPTSAGDKPCQCRNCEFCGRRAAQRRLKDLLERWEALPKNSAYSLYHIVIQSVYDPSKEADLTAEAMRSRVIDLEHAARAWWNPKRYLGYHSRLALKKQGAGLFYKVEISEGGFIHLHLLYYGAAGYPKEHAEALLQSVSSVVGKVWMERVAKGGETSVVKEICKYIAKGPSPLDEESLAGAPRERLNPRLAARWELAIYAVRTSERYGSFRGKLDDDDQAEEYHDQGDDQETPCPSCGVVGEWQWTSWPTTVWVRYWHRKGKRAFEGSKWEPLIDSLIKRDKGG